MNWTTLLLLGFTAGATILIGLPIGRLRGFGAAPRAALSMLAAGIILFLLVEILGQACGGAATAIRAAWGGGGTAGAAVLLTSLLLGGFLTGLVGLVALEQKILRAELPPDPQRLSFMIAAGIGLHNLSEGLAIGQAYTQKMTGLTASLITGFALHNATEGFGIVGPLVKSGKRPSWATLLLLAAIGGGPTFLGTLVGSLWTSSALSVFVLAIAGGSLLYVLRELLAGIRRETAQVAIATALVAGFAVGWATEVVADASLGGVSARAGDPDGDRAAPAVLSAGPLVSPEENSAQDQAANALLHGRALPAKTLPDGTKEYELTASVFPWQLYPGATVKAWGYNGQVPGPLLRLRVGERVQVVFRNDLPQPSTIHWHGLAVPNEQDGVPGVSQKAVPPGGRFVYTFTVTPQMIGTHLYHTHVNDDFQMDKGLHGVLIVEPASPPRRRYDVEAVYDIASFKLGGSEGENAFVLDGKAYPEAPALAVRRGDRVLIRLINSSAEESHVMHLHGYTFRIVARDGNPSPRPQSADTVLLAPSQTADIAFTADLPGKWMFHCHILDHSINPGPAGDGSETQMAGMGGLMTFIDVVTKATPGPGYVSAESLTQDMASMGQ